MSKQSDLDRLQRLLSEQKRFHKTIRELTTPDLSALGFDSVAEMARQVSLAKPEFEPSFGLLGQVEELKRSLQMQSASGSEIVTALRDAVGQADTIADVVLAAQRDLTSLETQLDRFVDVAVAPTRRVQNLLATLEASTKLYRLSGSTIADSLEVAHSYQRFVERQLRHLTEDSRTIAERRAVISDLAGEVLQRTRIAGDLGVLHFHDESMEKPDYEFEPNLFSSLNHHLSFAYRGDIDVNAQEAFLAAVPQRISALGASIVELVCQINDTTNRNGDGNTFKPTNKNLRACKIITTHIAHDQLSFDNVIDYLFFFLYEGSGEAKRLVELAGDSLLEPIWTLKHLRLSARHDVDHGQAGKVRAKHKKIGDAFGSLIGRRVATKARDWTRAQLALYEQLESMLRAILDKLDGR